MQPIQAELAIKPYGAVTLTDHFYRALSLSMATFVNNLTISNEGAPNVFDTGFESGSINLNKYNVNMQYLLLGLTNESFNSIITPPSSYLYTYYSNTSASSSIDYIPYSDGTDYYAWHAHDAASDTVVIAEPPQFHVYTRSAVDDMLNNPIIPYEIVAVDLLNGIVTTIDEAYNFTSALDNKVTFNPAYLDDNGLLTAATTEISFSLSIRFVAGTVNTLQFTSAAICDQHMLPLILATFPVVTVGISQQLTLDFAIALDSSTVTVTSN